MSRRIQLELVDRGVQAIAELYDEDAPKTCAAMWKALEQPIETSTLHAIMMGRALEIGLPKENRRFDPTEVPMENATLTPVPGELAWIHFRPGAIRRLESPSWDLLIAYGPEVIFRTPAGPAPANVWARIVQNQEPFRRECAKLWFAGSTRICIRRNEQ